MLLKDAVSKVSFVASVLRWPTSEEWFGRDVEGNGRDQVCLTETTRVSFQIRAVLHPEPTEHSAGVLASCLQVSAIEEHNPCARCDCIRNINFIICVLLFLVVSPTNISTWMEMCVCLCWQPCEVHWPVHWSLISNRSGYKIIVLNLSVADDMTSVARGHHCFILGNW